MRRAKRGWLAACCVLAVPAAVQAQGAGPGDAWTFAITPYLWLPNVNGTLAFTPPTGGGGADVGVGPHDWLQSLQGVFMVTGEARQGRWGVLTDLIYLDFSDQKSQIKNVNFDIGRVPVAADANLATRAGLSGGLWTLVGTYRLREDTGAWLDGYGGLRYLDLKASVDWQLASSVTLPGSTRTFAASGSLSQRQALWDAIVGVRGRVRLGTGKWSVPYAFDIGAGSSSTTWQAMAGLAYTYGWGDLQFVYRHLAVDVDDGKLLQNIRLSGPAVAATFRF